MTLKEFFAQYPKVAVAFSGGVDSSFLLYSAVKYAKEVGAYYVKSAFQPQFETDDAIRLAREVGAEPKIIQLDVLSDESITENSELRCYFCKKKIMTAVKTQAEKDGFFVLLDGTNASDDVLSRPGTKALRELSVLSPLRMCGMTKDEVRRESREAELFTWNKPAYACLATRIRTGEKITAEKLVATEKCEDFLFSLGFSDFRIRSFGDNAKIQVAKNQFDMLIRHREAVVKELKRYYCEVLLDMEGRDEN